MSDIVIRGEGLGKRYRRGVTGPPETLRDALTRLIKSPLAAARRPSQEYFWALHDVALEVRHGEVLGLIGRNGAGKTTLLKILSRITRPTTGRAEIHGRVRSLLEVGTGFHSELSGRENTYLSGSILGMSKSEIDRKFDEIVAFAEVDKFIDTPVKHYSSGMYVRLAFAVAAHLEPEILLVDEVLAVGDVAFQKKCLGKMKEVGSHGRTIVFVSHNVNAIATLCSSAMVLVDGKTALFTHNVGEALRHYLSSATSAHTVDLCNHPGRASDQAVFEKIEIYDENSKPSHALLPGAKVTLHLTVRPPGRISTPKISIGVTNERGERIFAIGTYIGGTEISAIEGPTTVRVRFQIPHLVPGQYGLDIGFYDRNGIPLDEVYGAANLDVLKDNYISMIESHSRYLGNIMVRSEWTCIEDTEVNSNELISTASPDQNSSGRGS
jgi:lipopolysaccharide transport system ATP-binding protein